MEFGIFNAPYSHGYQAGTRSGAEVIAWDMQTTQWAEEFGLSEVFFAEHYTVAFEPSPAADLMIAAASRITSRIKLGAAAHLLPYHQPANLAMRLMWLDHMTEGRYIAGFAPGSYATDAQLFGTGDSNPSMLQEGLDIVEAIWTQEPPFKISGKHWTVDCPARPDGGSLGAHLRPRQSPRPEVVLTGMQPVSPTLLEAGRRGFSPMSQEVGVVALRKHWESYAAAAHEAGHTPDRANWRILRGFFVAETDQKARSLVVDGPMGQLWKSHLLPVIKTVKSKGGIASAGLGELFIDPGMTLDDLTVDWLVDNYWLVGSPETVAGKIEKLDAEVGGIGEIVSMVFDYSDDPNSYRRNLELLGTEVAPMVSHIGARSATA